MVVSFRRANHTYPTIPGPFPRKRSLLADDLRLRDSPGSANTTRHVVIVMDGLKEFTTEPLEWALENIMAAGGYVVTLLGVMPWLNIPLFSKTWQDVWMLDFEDLSMVKERNEWKSDVKYLKLQAVLDLCKKYGVVAQKQVVMGYPPRLLVVEKITSLHASWVVFDRHHQSRKNREFFARKIPCNMVMMTEGGEADMIRGRPMIEDRESTPGESPASSVPTPQLMISEDLKEILWEQPAEKNHEDQPWRLTMYQQKMTLDGIK